MTLDDIDEKTFGSPYGFLDYLETEMSEDSELFYGSPEIKQSADIGEIRSFFEQLEIGRDVWYMDVKPELESNDFETVVNAEVKYHSIDYYLPFAGTQEITMKMPEGSRRRASKVLTD